jgi:hypothetical protein
MATFNEMSGAILYGCNFGSGGTVVNHDMDGKQPRTTIGSVTSSVLG